MENKPSILIFVESRYKISRKRVKQTVQRVLETNGVRTRVEVSIAFVGDRKMSALNKQFRGKEGTTNILSFPLQEGESTRLPDDVVRLGDIVISYPVLIDEAAKEEMMVDDRADELVEHGMLHLLGLHHE